MLLETVNTIKEDLDLIHSGAMPEEIAEVVLNNQIPLIFKVWGDRRFLKSQLEEQALVNTCQIHWLWRRTEHLLENPATSL